MIDLIPTEEQAAVADGVAAFLRDAYPLERFRQVNQGRPGADRWAELAELGGFGVSVPEAAGGVGLGLVEDLLVFREFGRHMVSPAALGTRLAACAAAQAGEAALCADLLAGRRRAGLATPVAGGEVQLLEAGEGDLCVLASREAVRVFAADAFAGRVACHPLDETVRLDRARLAGAALVESREPKLVASARLLAGAMLCGLLEVVRDMAAEYARTRRQFGVPIGVFQGVKHPCADMALAAESAWSHAAYAALMVEAGEPDAAFHVAAVKLLAGESALDAARHNIQIHGGMGFTDEVDAQLVLKRAHVLHQLFDDPRTTPAALLDLPLSI
jgi:alkylation response protein AidB-like acyl-CoA dehydrogenase